MPQPDDATRLRHILGSAQEALQASHGRSRDDLDVDRMLGLALIRLLEVIGEAASGVSEGFRARHASIPWRQMTNMRNRLIHGYFDVSYNAVWETVNQELPPLIGQLERILAAEPDESKP